MNPYAYQRRSPKASVGAQVAKPSLTGLAKQFLTALAEANISSVTALAFVLFVAVSVGVVTMVSYAEISTPETYAQNINAQKLTEGKVLGVATYGYNQPVCQKNTANCLNYQLIGYSGSGWQVKVDYMLQKGFVGAVKVNNWAFMDSIAGNGLGYTGYDLMPGKTYTFVLYRKYANRLYKLTDFSITAPAAPKKEPVACMQDSYQCPDGTWVGRSSPSCSFVCASTSPKVPVPTPSPVPDTKPSYGYNFPPLPTTSAFRQVRPDLSVFYVEDDGTMRQVNGKNTTDIVQKLDGQYKGDYDMLMVVPGYDIGNEKAFGGRYPNNANFGNGKKHFAFQQLESIDTFIPGDANSQWNFNYLVVHEIAHAWGVYLNNNLMRGLFVDDGTAHWARNVLMPYPLLQGNCEKIYKDNGDGTASPVASDNCEMSKIRLDPFLMYMAGFYSKQEASSYKYMVLGVGEEQKFPSKIAGYLTIDDVINGSTLLPSGQKDFKMALVLVTPKGTPANQIQLQKLQTLADLIPGWWSKATENRSTITLQSTSIIPTPTPTIRVGQLINKAGTVLLVGNGVVYGIPSMAVFNSWGWNFANVVVANPSESALPQAGVVPSRDPACITALDQIAKKCGQVTITAFKITAPISGEKFQTGKSYAIKWEALDKSIANVDIELVSCTQLSGGSACGGSAQMIASNVTNSGSYVWVSSTPKFISNSGYQIRITQAGKTSGAVLSGTIYFYTVDNFSTLAASLNTSGGSTATVTPGTTMQKVSSFKLTSGSADGVKVSSVTISATRNIIGSNFQNLQIMSNGTRLGSVQTNFASNGEYVFSLGSPLVIPANSSAVVDVYLDVLTGASALGLDGQNLVGLKYASGYQVSNGAVITSAPAVAGQRIYYTKKTGLTANLSPTSPATQNVAGGATNKVAGVYKLVNLGNGVTISELAFSTVGVSSQPITAVYVNGNKAIMAVNIATFSNLNIQIGNLSSIDLAISADFQATGVTGGQSFTLNLTKVKYVSNSNGVAETLTTNVASNPMSFLSSFNDTYNTTPSAAVMSLGPSGNIPTGTAKQFNFIAIDADKDDLIYDVHWGDSDVWTMFRGPSGSTVGGLHTWKTAGSYTIKVIVQDGKGGKSINSFNVTVVNPVVVSPKPEETACQAPTNLSPSTILNSNTQTVTLSWGAVSGATAYNIRVDDGTSDRYSDTRFSTCSNSPHYYCENGVTGTSIVNVPVKSGRSYKFWVDPVYTTARNYCNGTTNFSVAVATIIPVTPTTSYSPIGSFDGEWPSICQNLIGWAVDGDNVNNPVTVQLFVDSNNSNGSAYVTLQANNMPRPDATPTIVGLYKSAGTIDHGWRYPIPTSLKDGKIHTIYAYGINTIGGGSTVQLGNSPKTIKCGP